MTRFVRIYHDPKDDPGSRVRVDYDPDDTGVFVLADENVLPEKTHDPDCIRVDALATINLDHTSVRWLRDQLIELCEHLEEERASAQRAAATTREVGRTTLDAVERCPHGNMPREAGSGHWRDWHRGHGCHLDPSKKGSP